MKKIALTALIAVAAALTGCASPARIEQMTAHTTPEARVVKTVMSGNIAVKDVSGGKETNPMWKSNVGNSEFEQALEESLREAGMLASGKQMGKYQLVAHMEAIDQPFAGFSMTVTATVNYVLVERATGKEVFSRRVALPFTAGMGAAFSGVERLRLANEGAVRVNIANIIDEIRRFGVSSVAVN